MFPVSRPRYDFFARVWDAEIPKKFIIIFVNLYFVQNIKYRSKKVKVKQHVLILAQGKTILLGPISFSNTM